MMSDVSVNDADRCCFVSPRHCIHCGQPMSASLTGDSTDPCASDTDPDRPDASAGGGGAVQPSPRVVVSDPSLVSSRSSTPLDGFVAPAPAPLAGSDDECASLLSSDDYASSDDLDSEYVSAMEVPETQAGDGGVPAGARDSSNSCYVFGSTCDNENDLNCDNDDDDDDDDDDDEDSVPGNWTLTCSDPLQESSNSASTLLEDADEAPQSRDAGNGGGRDQSSSDDDIDDDDDDDDDAVYRDEIEITLLADVSDDADGEDSSSVAPSNNPMIEPLLAPAGDSDQSDPN